MITKFTISKTCAPSAFIVKRTIDRVSGVYFFYTQDDGRGGSLAVRKRLATAEHEFHDTWQAAKDALVAVAQDARQKALVALAEADQWLANANALIPPEERLACHVCGQPMEVGGDGVSRHIADSGLQDFNADRDHVPYSLDAE